MTTTTWPRAVLLRVPRGQAIGGHGGVGLLPCTVDEDGTVWAWDTVAGQATRHHGLTPEQEERVRRAAERGQVVT